MRRLAWAALACLLLVGLVPTMASAQSAAGEEFVIDIDTTIPVIGSPLTGTFTITPTASAGATQQGPWSFTGTMAGQPVSARGQGQGTVRDNQTITFELTSVDEWQMGSVPRPAAPSNITLRSAGSTVSLTWEQVGLTGQFAVSPALSVSNAASGGHYRLTSATAGNQPAVQTLPQTGSGASLTAASWHASVLVSLALAALCAAAGLWLRRSDDLRDSGIRRA